MVTNTPEQLMFRSPESIQKYASRRYQSRMQRLVDRREQATLKRLLDLHVGRGNLQVLDVPCGYGRLIPLLSSLGYQLQWADNAPSAVQYVRSLTPGSENRAIIANIIDMPLADGAVDLITTIRLFQHFPDKERRIAALREIARVTRRWAVVSFYDRRSLHSLTKELGRRMQQRPKRIWMQTRTDFASEAKQSGFAVHAFATPARSLHAHTFALLERVEPG